MTATDEEKDWRKMEIIDLIERLRKKPEKGFEVSPLMLEAAYEIERLMWDSIEWKQAALDNLSECKRARWENKVMLRALCLIAGEKNETDRNN